MAPSQLDEALRGSDALSSFSDAVSLVKMEVVAAECTAVQEKEAAEQKAERYREAAIQVQDELKVSSNNETTHAQATAVALSLGGGCARRAYHPPPHCRQR